MEYELKKTQLTFAETLRIVADAVDTSFKIDENGNDLDFRPECKDVSLQCAFCENYLDVELSDNFDEAFATYMSVDIDEYLRDSKANMGQWYAICHAVTDKIEYRKQKLLNKISNENSSTLTNLVSELVQKEIAVQDLQKKVLEQTEKINNEYNKEEILAMTNTFAEVNKLSNNPEYLKAVADAVHKDNVKKINAPKDHKPKKKNLKKVVDVPSESGE